MKESAIINNLEFQVKARNDRITNLETEIKELKIKNNKYWKENKELKEKIIEQNRRLRFVTACSPDKENDCIESSVYGNSNKELKIKLRNREQRIKMLERMVDSLRIELNRYVPKEVSNER